MEILVYSGFMVLFFVFWLWILRGDSHLYPDIDR